MNRACAGGCVGKRRRCGGYSIFTNVELYDSRDVTRVAKQADVGRVVLVVLMKIKERGNSGHY